MANEHYTRITYKDGSTEIAKTWGLEASDLLDLLLKPGRGDWLRLNDLLVYLPEVKSFKVVP